MRIAHNPKTGEYLGLQGGEWKPLRIAENKAGDRLYLDVDGWKPLKAGTAETPDTPKSSNGRNAGLFARGVLEGVGEPFDFLASANPHTGFARMVGNLFPKAKQYIPQVALAQVKHKPVGEVAANALSLPQPETDGEKLGVAATRGAASALPTLALGGLPSVAKGAPALAKFLTAAPVEQLVSGAASGAASEAARQNGAGTAGQIGAGLVGGLLPGTLALGGRAAVRTGKAGARALEALSEGGQNRIAGENLRSMASHPERLVDTLKKALKDSDGEVIPGSLPTLGEVAEDAGLAVAQKGRRNKLPALSEREVAQNTARREYLTSSADELAPLSAYDTPEADSGAALRNAFTEQYGKQKQATRVAYDAVREGGSTFNLEPLRDALKDALPKSRYAAEMPADIRRFLATLDEDVQNGTLGTFDDLQDMRSRLGEIVTDANGKQDWTLKKFASDMLHRLDDYLDNSAEYADMPVTPQPGSAAYRAARQEALALSKAKVAADSPFWDTVWKHLDADSLARDFPDAKRELAALHGRGIFAPRGSGLPIDELADSLKTQGWLAADADSSTLVELLKSKARGKASAASELGNVLEGATQYGTGWTPEQLEKFKQAKATRREQAELFEQNFNKKMSSGLLRDDQILGNYFKSGPAGDGAAKDFLRAFGGDASAMDVMREHIVRKFRRAAVGEDGKVNLTRMQKWMASHADALSNFPELRKELADLVGRVARDMGRTRLMDSLSAVRGSPTAQNLATQAIMDTVLGKSLGRGNQGLAKAGIKGMLAGGANRFTQMLYGPADVRINELLDEAFLNPAFALELLENYRPYTPTVDLKSVLKDSAKAQANVQARSLLDLLADDDKKKRK